jgi:hypothetical protein
LRYSFLGEKSTTDESDEVEFGSELDSELNAEWSDVEAIESDDSENENVLKASIRYSIVSLFM